MLGESNIIKAVKQCGKMVEPGDKKNTAIRRDDLVDVERELISRLSPGFYMAMKKNGVEDGVKVAARSIFQAIKKMHPVDSPIVIVASTCSASYAQVLANYLPAMWWFTTGRTAMMTTNPHLLEVFGAPRSDESEPDPMDRLQKSALLSWLGADEQISFSSKREGQFANVVRTRSGRGCITVCFVSMTRPESEMIDGGDKEEFMRSLYGRLAAAIGANTAQLICHGPKVIPVRSRDQEKALFSDSVEV